jgi:hypothetical protein
MMAVISFFNYVYNGCGGNVEITKECFKLEKVQCPLTFHYFEDGKS